MCLLESFQQKKLNMYADFIRIIIATSPFGFEVWGNTGQSQSPNKCLLVNQTTLLTFCVQYEKKKIQLQPQWHQLLGTFTLALRASLTARFTPLTCIPTHANVGDRKHKLMQISLLSKVQVWSSLQDQHDHWAELKEWKL